MTSHPEHDVQSQPEDYKPEVSMSQSMPAQFQLRPYKVWIKTSENA